MIYSKSKFVQVGNRKNFNQIFTFLFLKFCSRWKNLISYSVYLHIMYLIKNVIRIRSVKIKQCMPHSWKMCYLINGDTFYQRQNVIKNTKPVKIVIHTRKFIRNFFLINMIIEIAWLSTEQFWSGTSTF